MKHNKLLTSTLIILTIFAKTAFAAESYDDRWYLSPTASYLWLDDDRKTSRSGHGLSLGLGKAVNENINLEVKGLYNRYQHQSDNSTADKYQWDSFGAAVEMQYYLYRDDLSPYFVTSAGLMDSNISGETVLGFIGDAGVGVAYKINDNLSLRSDVRYRFNDNFNKSITSGNRSRYNDVILNVGFVIPLGSKKTASAAISKNVESINTDLAGVNFRISSSTLTPKSKVILDKVAEKIKTLSEEGIMEVQGHTSNSGSEKGNMILSQKRAESVANYLKNKGVVNKIIASGYGQEMPIADNSTREGRLENRRVVIIWK